MVATPINVVMGDFLGGMSWVVPAFQLFRTGVVKASWGLQNIQLHKHGQIWSISQAFQVVRHYLGIDGDHLGIITWTISRSILFSFRLSSLNE